MWKIVNNSPYRKTKATRFNVKQHILGVLFSMKGTIQGYSQTSSDIYLTNFLPQESDLKEWEDSKYNTTDVTSGINAIKFSINSFSQIEKNNQFRELSEFHALHYKNLKTNKDDVPFKNLF